MKKSYGIIGANFGDEGKGLATEYFCRISDNPIVILSNGGCQRGHTVNHADYSFVFHHFGSGTLVGVPSYYSRNYIVNPMMFHKEYDRLKAIGSTPVCYRSPETKFQIPCDIFINQSRETERAATGNRHGSCGWGIWESIYRLSKIHTTIEEFHSMNIGTRIEYLKYMSETMCSIRRVDMGTKLGKLFMSDGMLTHFCEDFDFFYDKCKVLSEDELISDDSGYETLITECGQGLLLDTDYAPGTQDEIENHTTPSRTGYKKGIIGSFLPVLSEFNDIDHTNIYVSRTYITRHGNGPFDYKPIVNLVDETNVYNEWQGSIKFGMFADFDICDMFNRIRIDTDNRKYEIFLTHMNEHEAPKDLYSAASYHSYSKYSSDVEGVFVCGI